MLLVWTDGASRGNPGRAAAACIFQREGSVVSWGAKVLGESVTNNVAEYRGLIGALRHLPSVRLPGENVRIQSDSKLVVEQVNGRWSCKEARLAVLCREARTLLKDQHGIELVWVPRERNADADALCNRALDSSGGEATRAS